MTEPDDPGGRGAARVEVADEQDRPVDARALALLGDVALALAGIPEGITLSVALVGADRMTELKERYLGVRAATDVLSFEIDGPAATPPAVLGDVVICVEVADMNARALGRTLTEELRQLLVHGILHLAGRDHADPASEVAMAAEEHRILRAARAVA